MRLINIFRRIIELWLRKKVTGVMDIIEVHIEIQSVQGLYPPKSMINIRLNILVAYSRFLINLIEVIQLPKKEGEKDVKY